MAKISLLAYPGNPDRQNPYLYHLAAELEKLGHNVSMGLPEWNLLADFDIVWVHWPEQLISTYNNFDFAVFKDFLHSTNTKLFFTLHNYHPHGFYNNSPQSLTNDFLFCADRVFHLENFSYEQFGGRSKSSYILPHPIPASLSIPMGQTGVFSSGAIRNWSEILLILKVSAICKCLGITFTYIGRSEIGIAFARHLNIKSLIIFRRLQNMLVEIILSALLKYHRQLPRDEYVEIASHHRTYFCTKVDNLNSAGIYDAISMRQLLLSPDRTNMSSAAAKYQGKSYKCTAVSKLWRLIKFSTTADVNVSLYDMNVSRDTHEMRRILKLVSVDYPDEE